MNEKTFVIAQQFVGQAGAGDVGEFHLGLAGGGGGAAAFADVPNSTSGGLDHLIRHAFVAREKAAAKHDGGVIDGLRHLVAAKFAIPSVRQEHAGRTSLVHEGE